MWYWLFRLIFIIVLRSFFHLKVEGLENLPKKTNFIVVANHASLLDPIVITVAIPKKVYWLALRDLYKVTWLGWIMKKVEVLPTGRSSEKLIELVMQNKNVGIFPEGGVSRDGRLREFRRGAALLAIKTGRPIVPCAILGTYKTFPRRAKFPRPFVPIKVKIGQPKYLLKEFDDIIDDIFLQNGIFEIRNVIKEMCDSR